MTGLNLVLTSQDRATRFSLQTSSHISSRPLLSIYENDRQRYAVPKHEGGCIKLPWEPAQEYVLVVLFDTCIKGVNASVFHYEQLRPADQVANIPTNTNNIYLQKHFLRRQPPEQSTDHISPSQMQTLRKAEENRWEAECAENGHRVTRSHSKTTRRRRSILAQAPLPI